MAKLIGWIVILALAIIGGRVVWNMWQERGNAAPAEAPAVKAPAAAQQVQPTRTYTDPRPESVKLFKDDGTLTPQN